MKKLALLSILAGVAALAPAQTLVGLSSNFFAADPAQLWTINESTGAATFLTNVTLADGSSPSTSIVGLAYLDGTLYASDTFNDTPNDFGSINLSTGVFTPIGNQNGSINWWALAADPTSGTLYTVERDGGQANVGHLETVSTVDGSTTDLGQPVDANGNAINLDEIAFDTKNSTLYGLSGNNLYTINTSTDLATLFATTGDGFSNISDLTYDAFNDALFENDGSSKSLYAINPNTGAESLVGANGVGVSIDGLAAAPVPEPVSIASLALGVGALVRRQRLFRNKCK